MIEASTTSTVGFERAQCVAARHAPKFAPLDTIDQIVKCWCRGEYGKLSCEVLLERLPGEFGSPGERCMNIVGYIANLNVRHACIIHADRQKGNENPIRIVARIDSGL
jgi:hypothetical protein